MVARPGLHGGRVFKRAIVDGASALFSEEKALLLFHHINLLLKLLSLVLVFGLALVPLNELHLLNQASNLFCLPPLCLRLSIFAL